MNKLKQRKWPLPAFPIGHEVAGRIKTNENTAITLYDDNGIMVKPRDGYVYNPIPYPMDYHPSCYIGTGIVRAFPFPASVQPGSSGITGMLYRDGILYGVTGGDNAHLFRFSAKDNEIRDTGIFCRNSVRSSLAALPDGSIYAASDAPDSNCLYLWKGKTGDFEQIPINIEAGIRILIGVQNKANLYGISGKGEFFVFSPAAGKLIAKHFIDKDGLFSSVLSCGPDGRIYGAGRWGSLYCYNPAADRIDDLGLKAPALKGREFYNGVAGLLPDPENKTIYGGTAGDGILFRLDLNTMRIISLGKPLDQPYIRCLAFGNDKRLYGIAGKNCCHLFSYDPQCGDLSDLGVFQVKIPRFWHGYEFDAAVKSENGTIYFGENDRISHLFLYQP